jgi:hypothetical protein
VNNPVQAPDGFLRLGPLLYAALDPACRPQRAVKRGALPTYRVLRDLVQEELDGGGQGGQALFDLGIATSIAVLHMLREAGRQVGKTPREIADALTGSVSPDVVGVFTAVLDPDPDALAAPLEEAADDNLERFMDLVLDLADVAGVLAVGVALRDACEAEDVVAQLLAEAFPEDAEQPAAESN